MLNCKSGKQTYYFNSSLGVNKSLFENHKYGNWYYYLTKANGLPLKMMIETEQFSLTVTATEITPSKLDENLFSLPVGIQTEKKPN